jgi:hypothetical protein
VQEKTAAFLDTPLRLPEHAVIYVA